MIGLLHFKDNKYKMMNLVAQLQETGLTNESNLRIQLFKVAKRAMERIISRCYCVSHINNGLNRTSSLTQEDALDTRVYEVSLTILS